MLHFETRPVLLNVLTLAKGGPRFSATFHAVQDGEPSTISGKPQVDHIPFAAVTMKTFTTYLRMNLAVILLVERCPESMMCRQSSIRLSELAGKYDIVLFAPPNDDWQALLECQLGLRLEEKKVPTQIVVIDQVVRPTDN